MNPELLKKAIILAERIRKECPTIDIILLDQWRRSRKKDEWRLTYLSSVVSDCSNTCSTCPVYTTSGGEDNKQESSQLITTLVRASTEDLQNFSGNQIFLNCKSRQQYIDSFVNCFTIGCLSKTDMIDELDYVKSFRTVYDSKEPLDASESKIKQEIINRCIKQYPDKIKRLFIESIRETGLYQVLQNT